MPDPKDFERLPEIWRRVRETKPKPEGSAKLMPRKKPKPKLRPFPPRG